MGTRRQNERKFGNWTELPSGGREYWRDVLGAVTGKARYVKIVDLNESARPLRQESSTMTAIYSYTLTIPVTTWRKL